MQSSQAENSSSLFLFKSCDELNQEFLDLKTPQDVADLLDVSYSLLDYHIYKVPDSEKYAEFLIAKKSGGSRTISAPITALKILQRKLSQVLYSAYVPKAPVHGFTPSRSIVTNAEQHIGKRFVFNMDIKDFFGSIHFGRVRGIFMARPYDLPSNVSTVLAQICCFSNKLPQGAPTSPIVSNMVCARLDSQLRLLAKASYCTYTRYADDITFSTSLPKFSRKIVYKSSEHDEVFVGEQLLSIIQKNGFEVNWKKVRLQHKNYHQEVTGLTVNKFPNVDREFVRQISSMLHVWDKFGPASAQAGYIRIQIKKLGLSEEEVIEKQFPPFQEVLRGKINFLKMVKGKDNAIYQKYSAWYRRLSKEMLWNTKR